LTMRTNHEFIEALMVESRTGAFMQMFIITAIEKYAEHVDDVEKPENWPNMINWEAWQVCAKEVRVALKARI
jgi:hypothetical protein